MEMRLVPSQYHLFPCSHCLQRFMLLEEYALSQSFFNGRYSCWYVYFLATQSGARNVHILCSIVDESPNYGFILAMELTVMLLLCKTINCFLHRLVSRMIPYQDGGIKHVATKLTHPWNDVNQSLKYMYLNHHQHLK